MFKIYDLPFLELLDAVDQSGEETAEGHDAASFHPPYNAPQISESANLK